MPGVGCGSSVRESRANAKEGQARQKVHADLVREVEGGEQLVERRRRDRERDAAGGRVRVGRGAAGERLRRPGRRTASASTSTAGQQRLGLGRAAERTRARAARGLRARRRRRVPSDDLVALVLHSCGTHNTNTVRYVH